MDTIRKIKRDRILRFCVIERFGKIQWNFRFTVTRAQNT